MSNKNEVKKNATQRIEDLEQALVSLIQTLDNMARDVILTKDAVKLLGNKVEAMAKAAVKGESPTDEVLSRLMLENNVEELKQKVNALIGQGILEPRESVETQSFIVGRELEDDGTVANPRLQFALGAVGPEVQSKLMGSKPGTVVTIQEGKLRFEVLEVYGIVSPKTSEESEQKTTEEPATPTVGNA